MRLRDKGRVKQEEEEEEGVPHATGNRRARKKHRQQVTGNRCIYIHKTQPMKNSNLLQPAVRLFVYLHLVRLSLLSRASRTYVFSYLRSSGLCKETPCA